MVKNYAERLGGDYDLEQRGSAVSCTSLTRSQPTFHHLQVRHYADFKGVVFFIDPLYCCTVVHYLTVFSLAGCAFVHMDSICVS